MSVINSYIKKYLELNGGYTDDQINNFGRMTYDVYWLLVKEEKYPPADVLKPVDFRKTTDEIANRSGVSINFVQMFFRALFNAIKDGESKPEDLYISTATDIRELKREEVKEALGLNLLDSLYKKYLVLLVIGLAGYGIYKFKGRSKYGEA